MPSEPDWLPQEKLDRMQLDLMHHGDITRAALAERIVEDAAPVAAYTVVELASSSEDDAIRLKAAIYLLDRANGKPKTSTTINLTQDNPVLQVLEGVVMEGPSYDPGGVVEDATVIPDQPARSPFAPPFEE